MTRAVGKLVKERRIKFLDGRKARLLRQVNRIGGRAIERLLSAVMGDNRPADISGPNLLRRLDGLEVNGLELHRVGDLDVSHLLGVEDIVIAEYRDLGRQSRILVRRLILFPENDHGRFLALLDIPSAFLRLVERKPIGRAVTLGVACEGKQERIDASVLLSGVEVLRMPGLAAAQNRRSPGNHPLLQHGNDLIGDGLVDIERHKTSPLEGLKTEALGMWKQPHSPAAPPWRRN